MRLRAMRIAALAAAIGCAVTIGSGCRVRHLMMEIPDFETSQVLGVWLWRFDEQSGEYQRHCELVFGDVAEVGGVEQVEYEQRCLGVDPFHWSAPVNRDPAKPDAVMFTLTTTGVMAVGTYRASSYNEAGESDLSLEEFLGPLT